MPIFAWLMTAAALLFDVQFLSPVVAIIAAMIGAPLLVGLLLQLAFISLLIEALRNRVPRWLAIFPIVCFVAYYGVLAGQWLHLPAISAELAHSPGNGSLVFDRDVHSMVQSGGVDFNDMMARYDVPYVYHAFAGRSRITEDARACDNLDRNDASSDKTLFRIDIPGLNGSACFQEEAAALPASGVVTFEASDDDWRQVAGTATLVRTLAISVDGKKVADRLVSGEVRNLFFIPVPLVGCFLMDATSRSGCSAQFLDIGVKVWPTIELEDGTWWVDKHRAVDLLAEELALRPRTEEELRALVQPRR